MSARWVASGRISLSIQHSVPNLRCDGIVDLMSCQKKTTFRSAGFFMSSNINKRSGKINYGSSRPLMGPDKPDRQYHPLKLPKCENAPTDPCPFLSIVWVPEFIPHSMGPLRASKKICAWLFYAGMNIPPPQLQGSRRLTAEGTRGMQPSTEYGHGILGGA